MVLFVEHTFLQGRFIETSRCSILILRERLHLRTLQSFLNRFSRWRGMLPLLCTPIPSYPPLQWSFWDDSFFILAPMNHFAHNLHVHVRIEVQKLGEQADNVQKTWCYINVLLYNFHLFHLWKAAMNETCYWVWCMRSKALPGYCSYATYEMSHMYFSNATWTFVF